MTGQCSTKWRAAIDLPRILLLSAWCGSETRDCNVNECLIVVSFRYAVQLITPSKLHTKIQGSEEIGRDSVEAVAALFLDAKTSARILAEKKDKYMM